MVQQKHNSYKEKREKLSLYVPQYLFFCIQMLSLWILFSYRNLLSAYKYGGPAVEMK